MLRVLHFIAFLFHNLPYALSLTPSTVRKTINSHSTLHSSYSCHASVTTIQALHHGWSLQYSLITSCYKQLGRSRSPRMRYIQLLIELYVPRNYTEGFAPWRSSYSTVHTPGKRGEGVGISRLTKVQHKVLHTYTVYQTTNCLIHGYGESARWLYLPPSVGCALCSTYITSAIIFPYKTMG